MSLPSKVYAPVPRSQKVLEQPREGLTLVSFEVEEVDYFAHAPLFVQRTETAPEVAHAPRPAVPAEEKR
ncbi:MAG: hypothetical protein KGM43_12295 [Planctomycetota bacterium]|nr:hypothetical protein [Planctomycetota bacterium]